MQDPRPPGSGVLTVPGEPVVTRWRPQQWSAAAAEIMSLAPAVGSRPVLVAVDGRSGAGKTTAAERLAAEVPGAEVVHTDDVAWHESAFEWDHLLATGVLLPLRQGGGIAYRPPAWDPRRREGAIAVSAGCPLVIVEGVGSSRVGLASLLDATIWVQADDEAATRRGIERGALGFEHSGEEAATAFWREWQAAERPFLAADRPWDRADLILCGTPDLVLAEHIEAIGPVPVSDALVGPVSQPLGDLVLRAVAQDSGPQNCRC